MRSQVLDLKCWMLLQVVTHMRVCSPCIICHVCICHPQSISLFIWNCVFKTRKMKLWATLIFAAQVRCQDPPDTTKPSETTTTAAALPTTTPEPVIKCVVCEANSTIGENMDCFDGIGEEKDFTKDGACSYTYSRVEKDGQSVYTVKRGGTKDRGDAADYPRKNAEDQCRKLCDFYMFLTGIELRGTNLHRLKLQRSQCQRVVRSQWLCSRRPLFLRWRWDDNEGSNNDYCYDDDTYGTSQLQLLQLCWRELVRELYRYCLIHYAVDLKTHLDLADCGTLDDNTASMIVCGAEDISSCITQFKKSSDAVAGIDSMEVARDCNGKTV